MLSVVMPARNGKQMTLECLTSVLQVCGRLFSPDQVEHIWLDDFSEPVHGITELFQQARGWTQSKVRIARFKAHQHYTRSFAHGLSLATGDKVLFVSNDMILTTPFLRTLLAVSALDDRIGVVRGRSQYTDSHPEYVTPVPPQLPLRTSDDVEHFAELVGRYAGLQCREDEILSGDCVLISRRLLDAIGVFDPRYFGYFGDPDFGLRAQRNGFRLVCALGAWLHHRGGGYVSTDIQTKGEEQRVAYERRMKVVGEAYLKYREKWGDWLPPAYDPGRPLVETLGIARLRKERAASDYIAPLPHDPGVYELL
jgi:GT2 family glycosyltransferase